MKYGLSIGPREHRFREGGLQLEGKARPSSLRHGREKKKGNVSFCG